MNPSRRLRWDPRPNSLSLAKSAALASGRRLIDLTLSNPTQAGIAYPDDLLAALCDRRAMTYQPDAAGLLMTREAVAEYYVGHGAHVHPDQVILTASTSEAYHYLFKLLANPGDEVLIPRPSYPLFDFLAGLELLDTVPYRLSNPDPCNLATDRTRALVTVHPNNPTGTGLTVAQAQSLATRCASLDMAMIADEVFLDYPVAGPIPQTMAQLPDGGPFVLSGLSKVCGLPQMKLGWMVLTGQVEPAVREGLELIADTYLSVSAPIQWAGIEWLRRREEIQSSILNRIAESNLWLRKWTKDHGVGYNPPEAGWTAVLELPSTFDEEVLVMRMLTEYGIVVQPGYFYEFQGLPRLVVSLLTPSHDLEEGMGGLKAVLSDLLGEENN